MKGETTEKKMTKTISHATSFRFTQSLSMGTILPEIK